MGSNIVQAESGKNVSHKHLPNSLTKYELKNCAGGTLKQRYRPGFTVMWWYRVHKIGTHGRLMAQLYVGLIFCRDRYRISIK